MEAVKPGAGVATFEAALELVRDTETHVDSNLDSNLAHIAAA
jgi:hypothetical protein